MKKMNNKGFSLVELIVVIAIMAVLVGVLAPQFIKYVENSRQSTDLQNIQQLKTAVEVAVASGDHSGNATITVTATAGTAGSVTTSVAAANLSCAQSFNLKSSTWTGATFELNATGGTWSMTTGTATAEIQDIFE